MKIKDQAIRKLLYYGSAIYTVLFLVLTVIKYGLLSSISKSAYYWQADEQVFMFYSFIWIICLSITFVSYSGLMAIAASILAIIGTWTGWNPNILVGYEHTLHVVCAFSGITLALIDIFIKGVKSEKLLTETLFLIIGFISVSFTLLITKTNNYIYWIEVLAIIVVYVFYFKYLKK